MINGENTYNAKQTKKLEKMATYSLYISALQKNMTQFEFAKYVLKNKHKFSNSTIKEALYIVYC